MNDKPAVREGYELMAKFPPGEAIVSMINYNGTVVVATTARVYRMHEGQFYPLEFLMLKDPAP